MKKEYTMQQLEAMEAQVLEKLLTPRERVFCEQYLAEHNGTQAAQVAGYSPDNAAAAAVTASRLLRRAKIAAYLRVRGREICAQLHITPESVVADLMRLYRRSTQAEQVMEFDHNLRELVPTGEYTFDSRGALKALELLGEHLGMFDKGLRLSGGVDGKIVVELGAGEELAK